MMKSFDDMIEELSTQMGTSLSPDHHGRCKLVIDNSLAIQMEPDRTEDRQMVISTIIGELPPGHYRENVLREALIANHLETRIGVLCFIEKLGSLALFERKDMVHTSGEQLEEYLGEFLEYAKAWKDAIHNGAIRPI